MTMTIDRRRLLIGSGATLALPLFPSQMASAATPRLRLVYVYAPNGVAREGWDMTAGGPVAASLRPLASVWDRITVVRGLDLTAADPGRDGPGDHARAAGSFLTCQRAVKTAADGIRVGTSVDQAAALGGGVRGRFRSITAAVDPAATGDCDSGYACAYTHNVSWTTPTLPGPRIVSPAVLFDRLFPAAEQHQRTVERRASRRSVLDFVVGEAADLRRRLTASEQSKLDEYLAAVRELELQIAATPDTRPDPGGEPRPAAAGDYETLVNQFFDLLSLALVTDATRVATFMLAAEGSNRVYGNLGLRDGHHSLTHHGGDAVKIAQVASINRYHVALFARFLTKLAAQVEDGESLLDRCLIVYGSGISDGNRHNHDDLPLIVAGRAEGRIPGGRVVELRGRPLASLHLTALQWFGVASDRFADSDGPLLLD